MFASWQFLWLAALLRSDLHEIVGTTGRDAVCTCVRVCAQEMHSSKLAETTDQQRELISGLEASYARRTTDLERQRLETVESLEAEHANRLARLEETHVVQVKELERTYSVSRHVPSTKLLCAREPRDGVAVC